MAPRFCNPTTVLSCSAQTNLTLRYQNCEYSSKKANLMKTISDDLSRNSLPSGCFNVVLCSYKSLSSCRKAQKRKTKKDRLPGLAHLWSTTAWQKRVLASFLNPCKGSVDHTSIDLKVFSSTTLRSSSLYHSYSVGSFFDHS